MKTITELVQSLAGAFFKKKYAAPIEEGTTPSRAYEVGELLIHSGQLCKVTSALTTSTTMVIGTNIEVTTLSSGLANPTTKMDIDGGNASSHVEFGTAFTVGSRKSGSTIGSQSTAFGNLNAASGTGSVAEGSSTTASGNYSHSQGYNTTASGKYSFSSGDGSTASKEGSAAFGKGTKTGLNYQLVCGKYNRGKSNTIFEVGYGSSSSSTSNEFEVNTGGVASARSRFESLKLHATDSVLVGSDLYTHGNTYQCYVTSTAASTAVAWCNKIAKVDVDCGGVGYGINIYVFIYLGKVDEIAYPQWTSGDKPAITSITLYDKATAKQTIASTNFDVYDATFGTDSYGNYLLELDFIVSSNFVTQTVYDAVLAVMNSTSPGFACVYASGSLGFDFTMKPEMNNIVVRHSCLDSRFNSFPTENIMNDGGNLTQRVGDFYIPTGGGRWNLEIEVDPGTAYYAVCYLENTTTGAYFNHSICYAGVPVPTIAAPTVAPAPVAGKVIAFVGTTWTPFVAGVAGVVDAEGTVTTKPRLRIQGYHSSNTPTAGLGMHIRLFRIY